jgi:hypothetical protein
MPRRPAGPAGTDADLTTRVVAWVERTCMDQGVPVKISDPVVVAAIVAVLAQARQKGASRDSSKRL